MGQEAHAAASLGTRRASLVAAALIGPLCVLLWFGGELNPLLQYERDRVLAGEWWRLITGHLVHLDAAHLAVNAVVILAWLSLFDERSLGWILSASCCYALLAGLGLLIFSAELTWMLGASAITYALVGGSAFRALLRGPRLLGAAVLGALGLKALAEQAWGLESWLSHFVDYPIASEAHVYGIAAGIVLLIPLRRLPTGWLVAIALLWLVGGELVTDAATSPAQARPFGLIDAV